MDISSSNNPILSTVYPNGYPYSLEGNISLYESKGGSTRCKKRKSTRFKKKQSRRLKKKDPTKKKSSSRVIYKL
jgi:hypothetical protein